MVTERIKEVILYDVGDDYYDSGAITFVGEGGIEVDCNMLNLYRMVGGVMVYIVLN